MRLRRRFSAPTELVVLGGERLRVGPWRETADVGYIAPLADATPPSMPTVRRCIDRLRRRNVREIVTAAIGEREAGPFLDLGFVVHERLALLSHDLIGGPRPNGVATRRARRSDRPAILRVDNEAFSPFWQLDEAGLREALTATPATRFRCTGDTDVTGYAIFGRAGDRGYLQRLAVDPSRHRGGLASALVADGFAWALRRGVRSVLVNTQEENTGALAFYERTGFVRERHGLVVCRLVLEEPA
ncbi:MAG: GNAT family N-acetyltransferase [Actinomycetota bacterium]|nr:GNAT family N-acetyltransferase [Actinomycetota bacterium]